MKHTVARNRITKEERPVDPADPKSEYYTLDKREWDFVVVEDAICNTCEDRIKCDRIYIMPCQAEQSELLMKIREVQLR